MGSRFSRGCRKQAWRIAAERANLFYRDASRDISTRWRRCSVAFVRGQLENCALLLVSLDELNLRFTTRGIRNHQYIYIYILLGSLFTISSNFNVIDAGKRLSFIIFFIFPFGQVR